MWGGAFHLPVSDGSAVEKRVGFRRFEILAAFESKKTANLGMRRHCRVMAGCHDEQVRYNVSGSAKTHLCAACGGEGARVVSQQIDASRAVLVTDD